MRTNLAPHQLDDPHLAAVEKNLRACVHCGICTATCPTYLLTGDERKSAEVVPPLYHRLKSVSHAPLAVCLALGDGGDVQISDKQRAELKEIASRVTAARGSLETAGFGPEALDRQLEEAQKSHQGADHPSRSR